MWLEAQLDLSIILPLCYCEQSKCYKFTYKAISKGLVEGPHFKVKPLVDDGPDLWVGRIEIVSLLAVRGHEVGDGSTTLVHDEVTVDNDRNIVLRIQLEVKNDSPL